ncbi:FeoA family protein [Methanosphaera cuniculi]|uniref:FeoA domain protein n=1 Tax=Methanosphaera cuniculi TaxID=1077256 RepID=A0A2A2HFP8_9EURY|nr:FeoA family protein [Methanosphaera cuniculi]PAV08227.1 iron transporter FeoA [Methanosphaera cuniculi]PWL08314.1 FeoA domain protein [Methanosphaera cuniculi]
MSKTVDDLTKGETGIIKNYTSKSEIAKRLREMGIVSGTPIELKGKAPLGYPIEVRIQGFNLALRKDEARAIELE